MNADPLEVHYGKISSKKYAVYIKRGDITIQIAGPLTETKAESTASMLGATLAVLGDNLSAAVAIRDP